MYRDKDAQLRRLERELLRDDDAPVPQPGEDNPEEPVFRNFANGYCVRGNQAADVDMQEYSDRVYNAPKSRKPLIITALSLLCILLGALCWLVWQNPGVLG